MRQEVPRPFVVPAQVRGAMAQQQVRTGVALNAALPPAYDNDAEAAAGGVPLNGVYRYGEHFVVRTV